MPKYSHNAVERNQLKRRLKEVVRMHLLSNTRPLDIVIKAQARAYDATVKTLADEMDELLQRFLEESA